VSLECGESFARREWLLGNRVRRHLLYIDGRGSKVNAMIGAVVDFGLREKFLVLAIAIVLLILGVFG